MTQSIYQQFIYLRTYSRWLPNRGRREKWPETVERYVSYLEKCFGPLILNRDTIKNAIINHEVMPSMRLLWSAGEACDTSNATAFNCSYLVPKELQDFGEMMFLLMNGCGVGFSCEKELTKNKLPVIHLQRGGGRPRVVFEDSREGWADGFVRVLELLYDGYSPIFDLSRIRPRGERLKTLGGTASGPECLKELLEFASKTVCAQQGRRLNTIDIHDLCCKIGLVVEMGGVRRSSEISLSDLDDRHLRNAKRGEFWKEHPYRSAANNSVAYKEKPTQKAFVSEWLELMEGGTGERGIFSRVSLPNILPTRRLKINPDLSEFGCNPCLRGNAEVITPTGLTTIDEIKRGDLIWSAEGWTTVLDKWSTGLNSVYRYATMIGPFFSTANHRVMSGGQKVPATLAEAIDTLAVPDTIAGLERWSSSCKTWEGKFNQVIRKTLHSYEETFDIIVSNNSHTFWCQGFNISNCGEILLRSHSFCNLSTIIARPTDTQKSLLRKIEIAAVLGTYQSALTNFSYIKPIWRENCEEERLLGVSITGQMDAPHLWNYKSLQELRRVVRAVNVKAAKKIGIKPSVATTTVKPEGTCSQLTNTSSGCHPRYAPYYIRRVRVSSSDPLGDFMQGQGLSIVEEGNNIIFEFPQKSPDGAITRYEMTAMQQLAHWRKLTRNYTEHNASCTIYVERDAWLEVAHWLWKQWDTLGGLSFLPRDEHIYKNAPYEEITGEEYEKRVEEFPKLDFSKLKEDEDNTTGSKELACVGGECEV